jgi:uncharacterized protein (TIGR02246 family)
MLTSRVSLLLFATCISLVLASAGSAARRPAAPKQEEAVRRLSNEEVQAFLHRDPDALARLWSENFLVTNPLNKLATKQQVLGMVRSGFLVITSYSREVEDVRAYGDTVILIGSEHVVWGGRMPNAGKAELLRFTAVWTKQGGNWREIARHANIVPVP